MSETGQMNSLLVDCALMALQFLHAVGAIKNANGQSRRAMPPTLGELSVIATADENISMPKFSASAPLKALRSADPQCLPIHAATAAVWTTRLEVNPSADGISDQRAQVFRNGKLACRVCLTGYFPTRSAAASVLTEKLRVWTEAFEQREALTSISGGDGSPMSASAQPES